jgi:hypothetical protein
MGAYMPDRFFWARDDEGTPTIGEQTPRQKSTRA